MTEQKCCENCKQKHDCQRIYEQLGDIKGPSVVIKVIVAFLLPILVFIVSLAFSERILRGVESSEQVKTALSFLLALLATFVCILIVRVIRKRISGLEN